MSLTCLEGLHDVRYIYIVDVDIASALPLEKYDLIQLGLQLAQGTCTCTTLLVTFVMVWVDRELRSEALGTFLIVLLGDGSVAETVLSGGGGILSIHLGFAVAVTVAYIHLCS
jgi:hypothetical protein